MWVDLGDTTCVLDHTEEDVRGMGNELEVEENADADEASSTSPSLHRHPPPFIGMLLWNAGI